jgi:hypothetical protein
MVSNGVKRKKAVSDVAKEDYNSRARFFIE